MNSGQLLTPKEAYEALENLESGEALRGMIHDKLIKAVEGTRGWSC